MRGLRIGIAAALTTMVSPAVTVAQERSTQEQTEAASSREEERRQLFAALKAAESEAEGRAAEDAVWRFWMEASDAETTRLVKAAVEARSEYDFAGARALLDRAVERSPDYAEAWNQRAFIRFLQDDLDGALSDLERALELEPKHFAAMAGQAMILMRQGRFDTAQSVLRRAVEIHPFLKERAMIVPQGEPRPSPPDGVDL